MGDAETPDQVRDGGSGRDPDGHATVRGMTLWFVGVVLLFGTLAIPHRAQAPAFSFETGRMVGVGLTLALLSAIDIKTLRLPNPLTYSLGAAGLIEAWFLVPDAFGVRLLGAVAGFAMLALVDEIYRRTRGIDGLGRGDAKLLGAGGAWIGLGGLPSALLIGSAVALAVALGAKALGRDIGLETRIPFGPFIAVGLWIVWLYGPIV